MSKVFFSLTACAAAWEANEKICIYTYTQIYIMGIGGAKYIHLCLGIFLNSLLGTATVSSTMRRSLCSTRRRSTSSATSATRSCTPARDCPFTVCRSTRRLLTRFPTPCQTAQTLRSRSLEWMASPRRTSGITRSRRTAASPIRMTMSRWPRRKSTVSGLW